MIEWNSTIEANAMNNGYLCFYSKYHPLATEACQYRVFLHRHIASIKYGRWLTTKEHVHHIDENKLNNHPDNLIVVSVSEHNKWHSAEKVKIACKMCGINFIPPKATSQYCSISCKSLAAVKNKNIDPGILQKEIWHIPFSRLGPLYGMTDMGIRKRAIALGLLMPPPRFHTKSTLDKIRLRAENNIPL